MYASETIQNCKNPTGHIDTLTPRGEKSYCSCPPTWPPWRHMQTINKGFLEKIDTWRKKYRLLHYLSITSGGIFEIY